MKAKLVNENMEDDKHEVNPAAKRMFSNDKEINKIIENILVWFKGQIGYVDPEFRDFYRDNIIERIKNALNNLDIH